MRPGNHAGLAGQADHLSRINNLVFDDETFAQVRIQRIKRLVFIPKIVFDRDCQPVWIIHVPRREREQPITAPYDLPCSHCHDRSARRPRDIHPGVNDVLEKIAPIAVICQGPVDVIDRDWPDKKEMVVIAQCPGNGVEGRPPGRFWLRRLGWENKPRRFSRRQGLKVWFLR